MAAAASSARRSTRASLQPLSLAEEQAADTLSRLEQRDLAAALRLSLNDDWNSDEEKSGAGSDANMASSTTRIQVQFWVQFGSNSSPFHENMNCLRHSFHNDPIQLNPILNAIRAVFVSHERITIRLKDTKTPTHWTQFARRKLNRTIGSGS
jgi:hypothetical protein